MLPVGTDLLWFMMVAEPKTASISVLDSSGTPHRAKIVGSPLPPPPGYMANNMDDSLHAAEPDLTGWSHGKKLHLPSWLGSLRLVCSIMLVLRS